MANGVVAGFSNCTVTTKELIADLCKVLNGSPVPYLLPDCPALSNRATMNG
jgi:hypothetical protein